MYFTNMLISLSLFAAVSSQIEIPGGKCLPVPVMPDFELGRYAGQWYEQLRYPFKRAGPDDKCTIATYAGIDETRISINNSVVRPDENAQWYRSQLPGIGFQTEVCVIKIE